MGLSKIAVVLSFLMIMANCGVSMGVLYKVGDSAGWTVLGNVDYNKWASSKNFHVGDTLLFHYNPLFHNVMEVTLQNFHSCNTTSPIKVYSTGNDSIKIQRPGHYYFICGFPGHCQAGQKVDVRVTTTSQPNSSPSPSPSPSPSQSASPPGAILASGPTQNNAAFSFHESKRIVLSMINLPFLVIALKCVLHEF